MKNYEPLETQKYMADKFKAQHKMEKKYRRRQTMNAWMTVLFFSAVGALGYWYTNGDLANLDWATLLHKARSVFA